MFPLEKRLDLLERFVTDADDLQPFAPILRLKLGEVRDASDARRTPSRPEFDDVHLSRFEFGHRLEKPFAVMDPVLDVECGGLGTDFEFRFERLGGPPGGREDADATDEG